MTSTKDLQAEELNLEFGVITLLALVATFVLSMLSAIFTDLWPVWTILASVLILVVLARIVFVMRAYRIKKGTT
jgi:hypothetical protein